MTISLNKSKVSLLQFLFGSFMLLALGCKKDLASSESGTLSQSEVQPQNKPISYSTNEVIMIDLSVYVPCANGGLGENVILSGPLHILTSFTISDNFVKGKYHYQPQGISGIGEISGAKYNATGVTQGNFSASFINGAYHDTFINNFRIIGQGPGNNYLVQSIFHITVNANGEVKSIVDKFSFDCK